MLLEDRFLPECFYRTRILAQYKSLGWKPKWLLNHPCRVHANDKRNGFQWFKMAFSVFLWTESKHYISPMPTTIGAFLKRNFHTCMGLLLILHLNTKKSKQQGKVSAHWNFYLLPLGTMSLTLIGETSEWAAIHLLHSCVFKAPKMELDLPLNSIINTLVWTCCILYCP